MTTTAVAAAEPPDAAAQAFAAMTAIESGQWDRYLLRLRAAIEQRRKTPEYKAHIVVRKDLAERFAKPTETRDAALQNLLDTRQPDLGSDD